MIGFSSATEINKRLQINSVSIVTRLQPGQSRVESDRQTESELQGKQDKALQVYSLFPDRETFYCENDLIFQSERWSSFCLLCDLIYKVCLETLLNIPATVCSAPSSYWKYKLLEMKLYVPHLDYTLSRIPFIFIYYFEGSDVFPEMWTVSHPEHHTASRDTTKTVFHQLCSFLFTTIRLPLDYHTFSIW